MPRANSSITVKDETTGVEHATQLISSVHYPVGLLADSYGYVEHDIYAAAALAMAVGASKHYLSIVNTEVSQLVDVIRSKIIVEMTAAVVGLTRGYRLFRCTGHSAGTLVTPEKLDTNSPNVPAGVTVRSNGQTITGIAAQPIGIDSLNEEETGAAGVGGDEGIFSYQRVGQPIVLRQNQGVTIQQDSTAGVGIRSAIIFFRVRSP